jgi:siroheme synthase (precorrin-2 oxidase/ferrochelatase)
VSWSAAARSASARRARCAKPGARVRVVAPALTSPSLTEMAQASTVEHVAAPFAPEHLDGGALLAIAATARPDVNARVADAARARGVLVNLAASTGENEDTGLR